MRVGECPAIEIMLKLQTDPHLLNENERFENKLTFSVLYGEFPEKHAM